MAPRRAVRRLPRAGVVRAPRRLLVPLALLLVAVGVTSQSSGATFASTTGTGVSVGAANDWTPPTVSVTSPGATVSGTVSVAAAASDARSAVASVRIEHAAAGSSTWTALCTDSSAPYSCAWDTTEVADGDHRLRAIATDTVGLSATSGVVTTTVANAVTVQLAAIADTVRGTVPLSATVTGAGSRSVTSSFERRPSGSTTPWGVVAGCGALTGTGPTCSWDTAGLTGTYDVRVVATAGSAQAVDTRVGVVVDNTAPSITMDVPSPMTGTVVLSPVVADAGSGVAQVGFAYRPSLSSAWTDLCTTTAAPHRCTLDTTKLVTGTAYDVRAIVTDRTGNTAQVVVTRLVQNLTASITITSPTAGAVVRGAVSLTADATAATGSTVTSVELQRRVSGTTAWVTICSDPTAPYSCSWDTTGVPSQGYELQAVMTQSLLGGSSRVTSATVPVYVDNIPLSGTKIAAANGGTAGTMGTGDTLAFEWSTLVDPATVLAGWNGSATSVTVTMTGGRGSGSGDTATFGNANLGTVAFGGKYVGNNSVVTVPATMLATTVQGKDGPVTRVTVTLGAPTGSVSSNVAATDGATWTPSGSVRTPGGTASTSATVSGPAAW